MRISSLFVIVCLTALGACTSRQPVTHPPGEVVETASGAARFTMPEGWVATADGDSTTLRRRGTGDLAIIVVRETPLHGRGLDAAARDTLDDLRKGLNAEGEYAIRAADLALEDRTAFVLIGHRGTGSRQHKLYLAGMVTSKHLVTIALDDPPPPRDDPTDETGRDTIRKLLDDVELSDAS